MSVTLNPQDELAQDFLSAWQDAHGFSAGQSRAFIGLDRLIILIEGAFSQAERKLAEVESGVILLRHYAVELLLPICDQMSERIRQVTGKEVRESDVSANPEIDQVMFIFRLEEIHP